MLRHVNDDSRDIITAVEVLAGFIDDATADEAQIVALRQLNLAQLMKLLRQSLLVVHSHQAIRTQQEQVIVLFDGHLSDLRLRNDEPLQIKVTDRPRHRQLSIDPLHAIFRRDPTAILNNALTLILPRRRLINRHFAHQARLFSEEGA